ncbi:MAG: ABC transporter permease [Chloroflexi bacterium]|nr:MAG: ABC transporter permease [Chloroflexota bacterium]
MLLAERILNVPLIRRSEALRSFTIAAWLGWQIESNWTDPLLFAIYSIARPIAGVLILVVMYSVITNGALREPIFAYIYLGNALYILVGQVITGVSWAVLDDREHYNTMKHLHTAPMNGYFYLLGRGVAKLIIASISVVITIGFGMIAFALPISPWTVDWPLFLGSTVLGVTSLAAIGIILGAWTMMMARHFWSLGEAVAGGLYLFTGAIFPLDVLPAWLRPLGFIFPVTYWLEMARRALLGQNLVGFPTLARFSNLQLLGILVGFTVALVIVSAYFYRWALHQAKERGLIDLETSH